MFHILCYTDGIESIDTVIFDFGNVFTIWNPYNALKEKYTFEQFEEFKEAVDWSELIEYWDGGATHAMVRDRIAEIDAKNGSNHTELYDYYTPRFTKTIEFCIEGMYELVIDLQKLGIKTYGLTNWGAEDIDDAIANIPAVGAMQGIVVSGIEKIKKPDPKIYQILLERYNVTPETAIFIDDRKDNTDAAETLGLNAFHLERPYESAAVRFREHLRGLGVAV